ITVQSMDDLIESNRKRRELEARQKALENAGRKIQAGEKREGAGFRELEQLRKQIGDVRDAIRNKESAVALLSAEVADLKKRASPPGLEGRTASGRQGTLTFSWEFAGGGVVRGGNTADKEPVTGSYSLSGSSFTMTLLDSSYSGTISGN